MNDVQKGIIAKEIFNKDCVQCKERDSICPLFDPDAYMYRKKQFTLGELKFRRCFSIVCKKGV